MSDSTHIEWADSTFNCWEGCTKVGPGCDHCYAEVRNNRFKGGNWGPGAPRRRTSEANWRKPLTWNKQAALGRFVQCDGCGLREFRKWDNTVPPGGLACCSNPECMALPETDSFLVRPRVFCASLADVFDNEVPDEWRFDLFKLIIDTPHLDWLLLTKRISNAAKMLPNIASRFDAMLDSNDRYRPLPNVWLGATVVNQEEADRDIPKLLAIPAAVRFLSMEPLLGEVSFVGMWVPYENPAIHENMLEALDWVIVGGESGTGARPMNPEWVRSLRDQCHAVGTAFLFKQWGEFGPNWFNDDDGNKIPGSEWMDPMGKKKAGRLLDGRTHDGYPS